MEREQMPKTLVEHGDTLVFVNSVGMLKEWLDAMPIKQTEFDGVGAEELEGFEAGCAGHPDKKNEVWEAAIQHAASTIYSRASTSKEIVWHMRPEFTPYLIHPAKLAVTFKFRCAFVPKESEDVPT